MGKPFLFNVRQIRRRRQRQRRRRSTAPPFRLPRFCSTLPTSFIPYIQVHIHIHTRVGKVSNLQEETASRVCEKAVPTITITCNFLRLILRRLRAWRLAQRQFHRTFKLFCWWRERFMRDARERTFSDDPPTLKIPSTFDDLGHHSTGEKVLRSPIPLWALLLSKYVLWNGYLRKLIYEQIALLSLSSLALVPK